MKAPEIEVRLLNEADRKAWEGLWQGYLDFYKMTLSAEMKELTWKRFHDSAEPMYALGAFEAGELHGITHYIFHRSCSTSGPYCYLQDLFTSEESRGRGIGRKLIDAVYEAARAAGASRVYWLTHETNGRAMALYDQVAERTGFIQYRKTI
jgi:GNAT superfamily N-acetyltransferase